MIKLQVEDKHRKWKNLLLPFCLNGSNGLVTTAITMVNDIGLCVRVITCDDTSTYISTMTKLGCKISGLYFEIIEFFTSPVQIFKEKRCPNKQLCKNQ